MIRHYADPVFLAPPWPEIFAPDEGRRHGFAEAVAEYERVTTALAALGYETRLLPGTDVGARADLVVGATL